MEIADPQLSHSPEGSACLDLVTQVVYYEADDQDIAFEDLDLQSSFARDGHEYGHWARMHGTSIGYLLNLLRYSRDRTASDALREVTDSASQSIRQKRLARGPLWSISDPYDPQLAGEGFGLLGQAWTDAYWTWNALFDMSKVSKIPCYPDESAPLALADSWLFSAGIYGHGDYPGNEIARSWLQGPVESVGTALGELSTRLLWECASTLDELLPQELEDYDSQLPVDQTLGGGEEWIQEDYQKLARVKLGNTPYGVPARLALATAGGPLKLITIYLLLDFALNPPLPMFETSSERRVNWSDFYPPARFMRAMEHVVFLDRLTRDWTVEIENIDDVYSDLSERSGLPYFDAGSIDLAGDPPIKATFSGDSPFHDALVSTSARLLSMRLIAPEPIVLAHGSRWLSRHLPQLPWKPFAEPAPWHPLAIEHPISSGLLMQPPLGEGDATRFITASIASRALDCLVNETSSLTLRLPREHALDRHLDRAVLDLARNLDWNADELRSYFI